MVYGWPLKATSFWCFHGSKTFRKISLKRKVYLSKSRNLPSELRQETILSARKAFSCRSLKSHSGLKNHYIEKRKTLYYHKITWKNHFWKNPENFRVRFFPGIRIFPDFFRQKPGQFHVDSGNLNYIKIRWELENCWSSQKKAQKSGFFPGIQIFPDFFSS